eukprot:scaffold154825_cov18-Tisochrysis_lutea.AAC.1
MDANKSMGNLATAQPMCGNILLEALPGPLFDMETGDTVLVLSKIVGFLPEAHIMSAMQVTAISKTQSG